MINVVITLWWTPLHTLMTLMLYVNLWNSIGSVLLTMEH